MDAIKLVVMGFGPACAAAGRDGGARFEIVVPERALPAPVARRERVALGRLRRMGVAVEALVSSGLGCGEVQGAGAYGTGVRGACAHVPDGVPTYTVVPDELRSDALVRRCGAHGLRLRDVAVVGTCPADRDALLEAECALALRDAGYKACLVADAVFPLRRDGGFVQALEYLVQPGASGGREIR